MTAHRRRLLTVLLVALFFAPCALAQTFFIAPDGDDSADGSRATPWQTFPAALDQVPDGATILALPGLYVGRQRVRGDFATGVTVRSETPYAAILERDGPVVTVYEGSGITIEGFEIRHAGPNATALVVHVQEQARGITLRNNIIHDSYNNDLLKINNGARDILVEGNLFYNQSGSDEHIDINSIEGVTVRQNVFFNAFEASGRSNPGNTSSFIVIKDSNGNDDGIIGARDVTVDGNVFLHWQGSAGNYYVLIGEDGQSYIEATQVTLSNNLFLGNGPDSLRSVFGVKSGSSVRFLFNTITGDTPANEFAFRLNTENSSIRNSDISMVGNIWSDPTGTMGRFSRVTATDNLSLAANLYFNGGSTINTLTEQVGPEADSLAVFIDPGLPGNASAVSPVWDGSSFADGNNTIAAVFASLVAAYGMPGADADSLGTSAATEVPTMDILGRPRGRIATRGAVQSGATIGVNVSPAGLWFDPRFPGFGFIVAPGADGSNVFLYYFGYADDAPLWLVAFEALPTSVPSDSVLERELRNGRQGQFDAPVAPELLSVWGNVRIELTGENTAIAELSGVDGTLNLELQRL